MAQFDITRTYTHKRFGRIGEVRFTGQIEEVRLNGQEVAADGVEHLLTFALQTLQDAYAGSENDDEAKASFEKKLDRIVNGEIGTRGPGTGLGEVEREAVSMFRAQVKGAVPGYAKLSPAERDKAVWSVLEKQSGIADIRKAAQAELDRKAALTGALPTLDLSSL